MRLKSFAVAGAIIAGGVSAALAQENPAARLAGAATQSAVASAKTRHQSGETTAGITALKAYIDSAGTSESLPAQLYLGYLQDAAKNTAESRKTFENLARLPEGINDAVRGEAALRVAYQETGRNRGVWAERIVAGQFEVTEKQLAEAHHLAAGVAQKRGDLRRAIYLYENSPAIQLGAVNRTHPLKELAGLYFEMAKGEGDEPLAESARPGLFDLSRQMSQQIMAAPDATEPHRLVAELMHAETFWFEDDYQVSYDNTKALLDRWGRDPKAHSDGHVRIYINTAKTLQMQNCYVLGKFDEAAAIATDMTENPPGEHEEFDNSDSMRIGLVVLKLCADVRGDTEAATDFVLRAWDHSKDYLGTERNLRRKHEELHGLAGGE